jgi:heavy metal efflux system protein
MLICRALVSPILRDSAQRRAALIVNLRGYTLEFGGQFENLREAKTRLAIAVPAALVFIFVLIFMAFASVRQALLVYSGVPLAVTGGSFCPMAARYAF